MNIRTIRTIISLKSLLLPLDHFVFTLCDKTNTTFITQLERIIQNILICKHDTPDISIDHIISSHPLFEKLYYHIIPYKPISDYIDLDIELVSYIQTLQPCYIAWIHYLWSDKYPNSLLHITPMFCHFIQCIVHHV